MLMDRRKGPRTCQRLYTHAFDMHLHGAGPLNLTGVLTIIGGRQKVHVVEDRENSLVAGVCTSPRIGTDASRSAKGPIMHRSAS